MKSFQSDGISEVPISIPAGEPEKFYVYRFADAVIGSPEHDAIVAFLEANGIPTRSTPSAARFVVWDHAIQIQIQQFHMPDGVRLVSFSGLGFVKYEQCFDLVARPEEFGVQLVCVGEAFNLHDDPPLTTVDQINRLVEEKFADMAALINKKAVV